MLDLLFSEARPRPRFARKREADIFESEFYFREGLRLSLLSGSSLSPMNSIDNFGIPFTGLRNKVSRSCCGRQITMYERPRCDGIWTLARH
jgi:hypothetical protein